MTFARNVFDMLKFNRCVCVRARDGRDVGFTVMKVLNC